MSVKYLQVSVVVMGIKLPKQKELNVVYRITCFDTESNRVLQPAFPPQMYIYFVQHPLLTLPHA